MYDIFEFLGALDNNLRFKMNIEEVNKQIVKTEEAIKESENSLEILKQQLKYFKEARDNVNKEKYNKEILDIEFKESAITGKLLIADMTKDQMEVLEEYTVVPPSSKMWPELEKLAQELEMNDKANKDKEELIRQHRIIKPISLEIEDGVKNYITLIREAQEKQEEYFNQIAKLIKLDMEEQQLTLGEIRVRTKFNPTDNSKVNEIKTRAAELINLLEEYRDGAPPEVQRWVSLAQTEIETAAMYGVKAVTF